MANYFNTLSLRNQLEQFFITAGSVAVESYNSKLDKEKLAYKGRGLDTEFMFGGEVSLSKAIQDRPEDYTFNLNNLKQLSLLYPLELTSMKHSIPF